MGWVVALVAGALQPGQAQFEGGHRVWLGERSREWIPLRYSSDGKKVRQFSGGDSWVLEFVSVVGTGTRVRLSQPKGVSRNVDVAVNYFKEEGKALVTVSICQVPPAKLM